MTGAKEFGSALYELAAEEKIEDAVLQSLTAVQDAFVQNPDYLKLLSNPSVTKAERLTLVEQAFGATCQRHVVSFVKILCERQALKDLSACAKEYKSLLYDARGILPVMAECAVELTAEQTLKLKQKLESITGKTVELSCKTDKSLIAGIRVTYDGKRLDGTVKQRFDTLRNVLLAQ